MPRSVTAVFFFIFMIMAFETLAEFAYEDGESDGSISSEEDYNQIQSAEEKRSSGIYIHRRSCIRRSGACDHRPNECCFSSSCRCNLWGSNCRCQRVGLFQKWG